MPIETLPANASSDDLSEYMESVFAPTGDRPEAYRPRITRLDCDNPLGGAEYRMVAGNDEYGGEKSVIVRLTADEVANQNRARLAFRLGYIKLLGQIGQSLREEVLIEAIRNEREGE